MPSSSSNQQASDVVVVGGGHNALVCAAYLAEAGVSVTVLEGRDVLGGNTVTEELTLPGWQHDSCSTAHVVLQSNPLIRDDELGLLARYGLRYLVTDPAVVFPLHDGDLLTVHPDLAATAAEFARYSASDADALVTMIEDWNAGQRVAHAHLSAGLPLPDKPFAHSYEALRRRSAWDVIASTFQHPVVRQVMAWMALPPSNRRSAPAPVCCPPPSWPAGWPSAGPPRSAGRALCPTPWPPTSPTTGCHRDLGVGAVVARGIGALRRGAHRRRARVPGRPCRGGGQSPA